MGETSKGRGYPEKWVERVRAGAYPKNGRKTVKTKLASDRPKKCHKTNTGWVFMEKYVELIRLVVGRTMGTMIKGRDLPNKCVKRIRAKGYPKNGRKNDKYEIGVDSS